MRRSGAGPDRPRPSDCCSTMIAICSEVLDSRPYCRAFAETASRRPLVSLRGVSKVFSNGTVALQDMSLDIAQGEFVSLLGPSGCGKSTALRIIAGLGEPTVRHARLAGRAAVMPPAIRRRDIGFVFQEPTLMPWATVFNNVWLPLRLRGTGRRPSPRAEVMTALAMVGLAEFAELLSARALRRHEDARLDRPRADHQAEAPADGRAVRRARRDHPLQAQQRPSASLGEVRLDGRSSSPTRSSSGSISPSASWSWRPGRAGSSREIAVDAPYPREEEFRTSAVYNEFCRRASAALHDAMAASERSDGRPLEADSGVDRDRRGDSEPARRAPPPERRRARARASPCRSRC